MRTLIRLTVAAFLVGALIAPGIASSAAPVFVDVSESNPHVTEIEWLAATGVTRGCNPPVNDHYCPDSYVTRAQMAAFLARALHLPDAGAGNLFIDDNDSAFEPDIERLAAAGVTRGCNPPVNDHYCPDSYVTRAQMAAFLYRAIAKDWGEPHYDYWEWGYGLYNPDVPVDVQAAYDWSTVNFGTVALNDATLDRLNEILAINPNHKFLVRLWPTLGLGDNPDEHYGQATLFHYLFKPGVREAVLENIDYQINFVLDRLDKPQNVVGLTFEEELPYSFTTGRDTLGWSRGEPMPWDIARFESEINAALGEPFDMSKESHRMWWGEQYSATINEIHARMKQASGGLDVFYWPATAFRTLDMVEPGESIVQDDVIPIHYADIILPGLVDGIFGYPNNEEIWQQKTLDVAEAFDIPFWSQLSTHGGNRIMSWDDTVALARQQHPGNLGTMIYAQESTGAGVWNRMPYEDGVTVWTVEDHARKLIELLLRP